MKRGIEKTKPFLMQTGKLWLISSWAMVHMVNRNRDMDMTSNNIMSKPTTVKRVLLACMVVLILAILDRPPVFAGSADTGPPSFCELANEVKYYVVNISTTQVAQGSSGSAEIRKNHTRLAWSDDPRITPELAASFGLKEPKGALIADVLKDSPAEKAGFRQGDVVVRLNGIEVKDAHTLSRHVASPAPDTEVTMDIIRDWKETAKLAEAITLLR